MLHTHFARTSPHGAVQGFTARTEEEARDLARWHARCRTTESPRTLYPVTAAEAWDAWSRTHDTTGRVACHMSWQD